MADETKTWTISTLQDITFSRGCQICGKSFEISSLNDPRILCQNCVTTLMDIIKQKKDEQVTKSQTEEHITEISTDLISRQALCRYALNQKNKSVTPNDIMRFPSAKPKTGKWLEREYVQVCEDGYESAICSECGADVILEYPYDNFCPNCGIKMFEGDGEEE